MQCIAEEFKIDIDDVAEKVMKSKRDKFIAQMHEGNIWHASDGYWKTYISTDTGRRRVKRKTKEDLIEYLYSFYNGKEEADRQSRCTVTDLYPRWLEQKKLHGATDTYVRKIEQHWSKYYLSSEICDCSIVGLNKLILDNWANETIDKFNLTRKEYNNMAVIIRGIIEYAIDAEIIEDDVFSRVTINKRKFKKTRKKEDYKQVFNKTEMRQLNGILWSEVNEIQSLNRRAQSLIPLAIIFQFQTGVRVSELAALRFEDIVKEGDQYVVLIQKMYRFETKEIDEYTKGAYGDRAVLLTDEALQAVNIARELKEQNNIPTDGYIFSVTDEPPCYRAFRDRYMKYCEQIGTFPKATHSARRTFVSALMDGGGSINTVRTLCGHVDEKTTLNNYCHDLRTDSEKKILFEGSLNWNQ